MTCTRNDINAPIKHNICEDLSTEPFKDANDEQLGTDGSYHVTNFSGDQCEHQVRAPTLEGMKAVCSVLHVKNFQRCTLAFQNSLNANSVPLARRVNQEEATSTRIYLKSEISSKQGGTSQCCTLVVDNELDAFEDFNRHGHVYVKSQQQNIQANNMKNQFPARFFSESDQYFNVAQYIAFI